MSRSTALLATAWLSLPSLATAADPSLNAGAPQAGLIWIDWVIIALYAGGTIALGWYYSRGQRTTREYFVGSGQMSPWLIGVSLFATLLSTITYRSKPGEMIGKGPVVLIDVLAYPLVFVAVGYFLLPVYMRHRVTSAYELLEQRLGPSVRVLGAALFLALRLVWMSLLVYLTAQAIAIMMGVDAKWIPLIVIVSSAVAIVYTSLGGLRAVVITDLLQTILLYGGALLVIGVVTVRMGGFGWFPTEWNPNWDHQPVFSLDPSTRVTWVGTILSMFIWYVATSGGDQVSVQRFMATKDARAARKAFAIQLSVGALVNVTLGLVGFALLGYFLAHPDHLGQGLTLAKNADDIFPNFIAFHLPPVVSGLVVSGLFAAAMSSIDSGVNSITAVVMTDFMDRFGKKPANERQHFRRARWLAVAIGVVVVLLSLVIQHVPGNITAVTNKTVNLLTVPIFGLFFFALFVPFASTTGVWIGTVSGVTAAALVSFSGPIFGVHPVTGLDPITFQWIAPVALVVTVTMGMLGSLLFPNRRAADAPSS
jgi:solute:Na+ symporter, SSS family